jgi:hypothetical protein
VKAILPASIAGIFVCARCRRADVPPTDTAGHDAKFSGYFAGVAVRTNSGWTLRNAHWSIVHPKTQ